MSKKNQIQKAEYLIDYDLFTVEEVIKIISFMRLIEQTKQKKVSTKLLQEQYKEYRLILNNKSLEKQYNKMLEEKSGVSIYRIMKSIENHPS